MAARPMSNARPMSPTPPRPMQASRAAALTGRLTVPGDKSISHRALMFGALAVGTTTIAGLLEGEDVLRTAEAMRALGATVERLGEGAWRVSGRGVGGLAEPADVLDMGNSGTAARLICGDFSEATWQAFWQTAVEGRDGKTIAEELGLSTAAVYLAKGRVMVRLKEQVKWLLGSEGSEFSR